MQIINFGGTSFAFFFFSQVFGGRRNFLFPQKNAKLNHFLFMLGYICYVFKSLAFALFHELSQNFENDWRGYLSCSTRFKSQDQILFINYRENMLRSLIRPKTVRRLLEFQKRVTAFLVLQVSRKMQMKLHPDYIS